MKVLLEISDAPYTAKIFINNLKEVANIAEIKDKSQIAKALNEFKPDLLILKKENINATVKFFCDDNNVKIIDLDSFENKIVPIIGVTRFKEEVDKKDISILANNPNQKLFVDFLSKNYNVKVYGQKINSPRYLGQLTMIEKYEVINKSKVCIVFNEIDEYESVLLDTPTIMYNRDFDNIISLIECIDNMSVTELLNKKEYYKENNDIALSINILSELDFKEEAKQLEIILKETLVC